jgi:hypothetical protein
MDVKWAGTNPTLPGWNLVELGAPTMDRGNKMDRQTRHELLIIGIASLAPITLLTGAVVAILL